jgi:signal transduction histidine kinase
VNRNRAAVSRTGASSEAPAGERVIVLAPAGRDARVLVDVLGKAGISTTACGNAKDLTRNVNEQAGVVLLTQEALDEASVSTLLAIFSGQPTWSDIPLLVLADPEPLGRDVARAVVSLRAVGNVTVLERPVRSLTLLTAVQSGLRARRRQHEIRELVWSEHAAREAAEAASRVKDEFLATVTHELRTPLSAILLWAQMLARGDHEDDAKKLARGLDAIERSARMQARLIEDLLDVSRMRAGNLRLTIADIDLADVMVAAVEVVRPAADAKRIHLHESIERVPRVRADAGRIQQIVWNLLSNAVKFTPEGGDVWLALCARGGRVVLEVRDTGEGILAAFLPHVFERFRQADATVQRMHGGLGLGLAITRELVELHGGSVRVESGGRGQGARFVVELPVPVPMTLREAHG